MYSQSADSPQQVKILIVDDRDDNLLALEAVLTSPDYEHVKANSGELALKYLLENEPALILMDVQMPGLDGFETASLIKRSERTREIPIIFITAINKDERYVLKGYTHGAVDYLQKPFDSYVLRSKVAVFVDLYRKSRRLVETERKLRLADTRDRERKLAELELRSLRREHAEQRRYKDLVEGIHHGIVWSARAETLTFTFVSAAAEEILGYPLERWYDEPGFFERHIHPDDKPGYAERFQAAFSGDGLSDVEHRFLRADGSVAWLHTGARLVRGSDGEPAEIRGLSIDVTTQKEAEHRLAAQKQRSDFLSRASLFLASDKSCEQAIEKIGELAVRELGASLALSYAPEGEKRRAFHAWPDPERSGGWGARWLADGAGMPPAESTSFSIFPMIAREAPFGELRLSFRTADGAVTAEDAMMCEDLARRVAAAIDNSVLFRQAQAAVHIRDEFLSIASHELRTPMTPLKMQVQQLLRIATRPERPELSQERIVRMLQSSNQQIDRLAKLVDDLLDISRISEGKMQLNASEFDLAVLIREISSRFQDQLADAKSELHLELPASLHVRWDSFRIEQVIINLLTNAIKYAPGNPIAISASADDRGVTLRVKDRGIGIAKVDQKRIFNRFERAVSGNHFGGLGLGLYIVSQILEAHGGKIRVESEPGAGSEFIVSMPRVARIQPLSETGRAGSGSDRFAGAHSDGAHA